MRLNRVLAAAFEDEIVILDPDRASLLLLDAWAAQVWRSCDGATTKTIECSSNGPSARVHETLQALTDAGLVLPLGDTWTKGPVEWV